MGTAKTLPEKQKHLIFLQAIYKISFFPHSLNKYLNKLVLGITSSFLIKWCHGIHGKRETQKQKGSPIWNLESICSANASSEICYMCTN
jgi:hypothetical protein